MESLTKTEQIAVVHVAGHRKGNSPEARGNRAADEVAEWAALQGTVKIMSLVPLREGIEKIPVFSEFDIDRMNELGAKITKDGRWWKPDGKQLLNKEVIRELLGRLHSQSHWGLRHYVTLFYIRVLVGGYTLWLNTQSQAV